MIPVSPLPSPVPRGGGVHLLKHVLGNVILTTAALAGTLPSTPGRQDITFNQTGIVQVGLPARFETLEGMALQPDGKIVIAGFSSAADTPYPLVARFNSDGTLDSLFGTGGRATFPALHDWGLAGMAGIVVQPDGHVVVAGTAGPSGGSDAYMFRLTPGGTFDSGFGQAGLVLADFGSSTDACTAIALSVDGGILLGGSAYTGSVTGRDMVCAAFSAGGARLQGFGVNGIATVDFDSREERVRSIVVQQDGAIVLVGDTTHPVSSPQSWDFAAARLLPAGFPDPAFGTAGRVRTRFNLGLTNSARAGAIQPDGKLVVAGSVNYGFGSMTAFGVARYLPDGDLDTSFNGTGKMHTAIIMDEEGRGKADAYGVAIQQDGKILVTGGTSDFYNGTRASMGLVRINADGTLDASFSNSGRVTTDWNVVPSAWGRHVIIQEDGRILVGGTSSPSNNSDLTVVRFLGDAPSPVDPYFVWTQAMIPLGRDISLEGDPDGDGQSNLLEFVLRTDPLSPVQVTAGESTAGSGLPRLTLHEDGGQKFMRLWWWIPKDVFDHTIRYQVEGSADLISWRPLSYSMRSDHSLAHLDRMPGWMDVPVSFAPDAVRYLRIKVRYVP
jgi:uncharacterized delta-60 repeat protein